MIEGNERAPLPKWPRLDDVDLGQVAMSYDRDSDMLLVHFGARGRAGVVDYIGDYLALLTDVESQDVVGVQIEDFLSTAVLDDPSLLNLLDLAELRGITREQVSALRAAQPLDSRKRAAVAVVLGELARKTA